VSSESEIQNKDETHFKRPLSDKDDKDYEEAIVEKKPKIEPLNSETSEEKTDDNIVTAKKTNNIIKEQLVCTICDELMHDCVRYIN
jgi:hypothetical protein